MRPDKNLGALREIPEFDPDKEGGVGVGDFLEAVENAAFLGDLNADDLMRIIPMRLRGSAKGSSNQPDGMPTITAREAMAVSPCVRFHDSGAGQRLGAGTVTQRGGKRVDLRGGG